VTIRELNRPEYRKAARNIILGTVYDVEGRPRPKAEADGMFALLVKGLDGAGLRPAADKCIRYRMRHLVGQRVHVHF